MKKLTLSAFCLGLILVSTSFSAVNQKRMNVLISLSGDGRQIIKQEELPEAIKKTLSSDAYKGWSVKEAALVTVGSTQPAATQTTTAQNAQQPAATGTTMAVTATNTIVSGQTTNAYYEVILTKDKEINTVKFQKDGTIIK